ncbi:MAG: cupin domain-containing protein [Aquificae bacterium]|nr:cupin domain-containing protein [Aquificota bacterium]
MEHLVRRTGIVDRQKAQELLRKEGYGNLYLWSDPPETFYDWHTHPFDEVRFVLDGEILIGTEEGEVLLRPGDLLVVPAGTRHWAKVGPKGVSYLCGTKLTEP